MRLRHSSWVYEGEAIQAQDILDEDDLQFLLAADGALVRQGAALDPAGLRLRRPPIDGRVDKIVDNLGRREADVHGRRPAHLREGPRPDRHHAGRRGRRQGEDLQPGLRGRPPGRRSSSARASRSRSCSTCSTALFDKLVFSKVRERFGGRVRFFISGAAALNREIAEWFHAAGILILEGYGLTETSAGSFVNHPDDYKFGTVGPVFPGSEVKLGEGDEILIKGPGVMDGYHNLPEETAKTLTEDGWLRTGDKGALDADGFLRITGRIKELFKTSGGKYIAPPAIESQVQGDLPLRQPVHGVRQRAQLRASR